MTWRPLQETATASASSSKQLAGSMNFSSSPDRINPKSHKMLKSNPFMGSTRAYGGFRDSRDQRCTAAIGRKAVLTHPVFNGAFGYAVNSGSLDAGVVRCRGIRLKPGYAALPFRSLPEQ